jgi:2-succinyl-5-enolpyruvyl-6-hydroxy-3-cyclohexene-1-carboxylate synthase
VAELDLRPWLEFFRQLAEAGIWRWVACPGSRNAPLLRAIVELDLAVLSVIDERSAGYAALGWAQQCGAPAGVVTTSGTAALNLGPAAAEAFLTQTPALFLTADRPPEWLGQQDNQMVRQSGALDGSVAARFDLPVDKDHAEARWAMRRIAGDAAWNLVRGRPVHINAPIREPLYCGPVSADPAKRGRVDEPQEADAAAADRMAEAWERARRPLWITGLNRSRLPLGPARTGDILANLTEEAEWTASPEFWISQEPEPPDLLVSEGGPILSKDLRRWLRSAEGARHFHVGRGTPADTFWQGVESVPAWPDGRVLRDPAAEERRESARRGLNLAQSLATGTETDHAVVSTLNLQMARWSSVHLASSLAVRIAALLLEPRKGVRFFSNRGASGIDGCLSTAAGHAFAEPAGLHLAVIGDVALQYDLTALTWAPPNLRVLVLRNGGGMIFRALDRPSGTEAFERLLTTPPLPSVHGVCSDAGIRHLGIVSVSEVNSGIDELWDSGAGASVLEVRTDGEQTASLHRRILQELRSRP